MTVYVKATDGFIDVVNPEGLPKRVTQRAFDVIYKGRGYKLASDVEKENDYATFSEDELKKVKNDDLQAYLDKKEIEYPTESKKQDYIDAILGK
ncbi:hypothetical protein [Planococcus versutus]|uniref:HeH/LEM domain-containing protein n=1 Tax=Planococcus versutus TaxID=1302659 RepID=A0A1B1S5I1_9BACL|nr:hypothetical protein [Planococcus versutus]ANU28452.1 hypothetical protein I858_015795 [Planococcus versutus]